MEISTCSLYHFQITIFMHLFCISMYFISIHILSSEYKTQNDIVAMLPF